MGVVGDRIGGHRILERLEGYGREVFLTRRGDGSGALIALFDIDDDTAQKLEKVAATCLSLNDPHLAHVVELFRFEDKQAVVFEDVRGMSLESIVKALGEHEEQLTDGATLEIGLRLCRSLGAAHTARGEDGNVTPLVHGQLGPHQIFISFDGTVRLLGMGLGPIFMLKPNVKALPPTAARFAAPEVKGGGVVTARANTFTAAAILWSVLTLEEPPAKGGAFGKLVELRPDLPKRLTETIDAALQPVVFKRTVTCKQLASVIEDADLASKKELLWNIDVLRRVPELESMFPLESLPPTSGPRSDSERDSDDAPTATYDVSAVPSSAAALIDEMLQDDEPVDAATAEHSIASPTSAVGEDDVDGAWEIDDESDDDDVSDTKSPPAASVQQDESDEQKTPAAAELSKLKPGQHVMPGAKVKPLPPRRPPMSTMRGIADREITKVSAQDVAPSSKEETPKKPKNRAATDLISDDRARSTIERLRSRRDQIAKRDTMRLASNVGVEPDPAALRAPRPPRLEPAVEKAEQPAEAPDEATTQEIERPPLELMSPPPAPSAPTGDDLRDDTSEPERHVPNATEDTASPRRGRRTPATTEKLPASLVQELAAADAKERRLPIKTVELPPAPESEPDPVPPIPPLRQIQAPFAPEMVDAVVDAAPEPPPRLRILSQASPDIMPAESPSRGVDPWNIAGLAAFVGALGLAGGMALGRLTAPSPPPPKPAAPAVAPTVNPTVAPIPVPAKASTTAAPAAPPPSPPTADAATTLVSIDTTLPNPHVYLNGNHVGPVTEPMALPCGVHNIRLGTHPLTRWLSKGRSFRFECGGTLEISLEAYYAGKKLKR